MLPKTTDKIFNFLLLLLAAMMPLSIALTTVMFVALLVLWLLGGFWTFRSWKPSWSVVEKAFVLYLAISLMSAFHGISRSHSLHEIYKKDFYFLIYVVMAALITQRKVWERLLGVFMGSSLLSAAFGVLQYVIGVNQTDHHNGDFMNLPEALTQWPREILDLLSLVNGRVVGPRSHPLTFAGALLFALGFGLVWMKSENTAKARRWIIGSGILGVALLLTQSRGPWLAAAAMGLLALVLRPHRGSAVRLVIFALPFFLVLAIPTYRSRIFSIRDAQYHSNAERLRMWQAGVHMWEDHPWLGVGPGNVKQASPSYQNAEDQKEGPWGHLHNTFVNIAAERGSLGLLSFLLLIGTFGVVLIQQMAAVADSAYGALMSGAFLGWFGFLLAGLTQANYNDAIVNMTFYFVMGLALSAKRIHEEDRPATS